MFLTKKPHIKKFKTSIFNKQTAPLLSKTQIVSCTFSKPYICIYCNILLKNETVCIHDQATISSKNFLHTTWIQNKAIFYSRILPVEPAQRIYLWKNKHCAHEICNQSLRLDKSISIAPIDADKLHSLHNCISNYIFLSQYREVGSTAGWAKKISPFAQLCYRKIHFFSISTERRCSWSNWLGLPYELMCLGTSSALSMSVNGLQFILLKWAPSSI